MMIQAYYRENGSVYSRTIASSKNLPPVDQIFWIDVISPDEGARAIVERAFQVDLPTHHESLEIELSSRYHEEDGTITINTFFLVRHGDEQINETISFLLKYHFLITVRHTDIAGFDEMIAGILKDHERNETGLDVLVRILEVRIDYAADSLEANGKEITILTGKLKEGGDRRQKILGRINTLQEKTMTIRENITDKQRIIFALMKGRTRTELTGRLNIMSKDLGSLIEYSEFLFERLEYMQDTLLNYLNTEQNQIIKIFTVMSVVFLPPTLIASIYGMNFQHMPELHHELAYPIALGAMITSAVIPIVYFKIKRWL